MLADGLVIAILIMVLLILIGVFGLIVALLSGSSISIRIGSPNFDVCNHSIEEEHESD